MATYFCRCTSCRQNFLVDAFTYTPPFNELLEDADVRNFGKAKRSRYWEDRYPVQYVDSIDGLPSPIDAYYAEAIKALASKLPNAAGAMLRKTLEALTLGATLSSGIAAEKRAAYERATLATRLTLLKDGGVIPPALHDLVDTVRYEGNAAIHDVDPYTLEEAEVLRMFVEAFLHQVITLPRKISATRSAMARKPTDTTRQ